MNTHHRKYLPHVAIVTEKRAGAVTLREYLLPEFCVSKVDKGTSAWAL